MYSIPNCFLHLVEVFLDGLHLLLEMLNLSVVIVQNLGDVVSELFQCTSSGMTNLLCCLQCLLINVILRLCHVYPGAIHLHLQSLGVFVNGQHTGPDFFSAATERWVENGTFQLNKLFLQLLLSFIHGVSSVAKDLCLGSKGEASFAENNVFPPAISDLDGKVEVMLREKPSQAVVDLVQARLHHSEEVPLSLCALAQVPEAFYKHRDISWTRSLAQSLLPFCFIVLGTWLVERCGLLADIVVQIGSEW